MAYDKRNLKIDLLKIAFDKLLIGGLIILLGLWTATLIEKYKAKETFYNELNKVRVSKIAEVWEQAYLLDYRMKDFQRDWFQFLKDEMKNIRQIEVPPEILEAITGRPYDDRRSKLIGEWEKSQLEAEKKKHRQKFFEFKENHLNEFNMILHKNRFWLDDKSFSVLQDYVTTAYRLDIYIEMPHTKWAEEFSKRGKEMEQLREDIASIRRRVLLGED